MTPAASDTPAHPRSRRLEPGAADVADVAGAVFCGGASRRMGRDKARIVLEGATLLERAVDTLGAVTSAVILASGATARYPELGRECVLDLEPGAGPLSGLAAVLERFQREGRSYVCVLACDLPAVGPAVFGALLARARAADADVCLPASPAGLEPLCGVYHVRVLDEVRAALARGARRMDSFHGTLRVVRVAIEDLGLGADALRNLNTPQELLAAGGAGA